MTLSRPSPAPHLGGTRYPEGGAKGPQSTRGSASDKRKRGVTRVCGEAKGTKLSPRPVGERARVRGHVKRARALRREQTDAERMLWSHLRDRQLLGAKFRRQHPIGPYIVDVCCPERRLVVEVDGSHHAQRIESDRQRTDFLVRQGYRVLRFWDHDVLVNTEVVLEEIARAVADPHPSPLPGRERGRNRE